MEENVNTKGNSGTIIFLKWKKSGNRNKKRIALTDVTNKQTVKESFPEMFV